ncbi:MAG: glycosyltransferase family 4 protein [Pseudomonadota bacterium]
MSPRRILLIAGAAESLINFRGPLIAEMIAQGHEVHVAAPNYEVASGVRSALIGMGAKAHAIPLSRTGLNPLADLGALVALYRLMRRVRPDVALGYTIKPVVYGTLAAWMAGVPGRFAMITGLGYAFTGNAHGRRALVQRLARSLYRLALARTSGVMFQNPDDKALFAELGMLAPNVPVTIVNGSGVDLSHYAPQPLPKGPVQFLMIARLLGDKGLREYAAAAKEIRQTHPEVGIHLVGDHDSNPDAIPIDQIRAWQAEGWLTWHGALDDVRPAIAAAHVYVLPSYREGTPRTVLEAMAMGRPVITTNAPGCRETIVDGESGFLVPVCELKALCTAMRRFVDAPALINRMGAAAQERAKERYDVQVVNRQILDAIDLSR